MARKDEMAAPKTTVWDLEPHTRAKHEVLSRYLHAWFPILGMSAFPQVVYIDGFAGPGRYSNGEDGSPVIALKAALEYADRITGDTVFLFVEKEQDRADMLRSVVDDMGLPGHFNARVISGSTFDTELTSFIDNLSRPVPIFAFIDPFGWTGIPFSSIRKILTLPNCEVLVNLMYENVNRFISTPGQADNFDALFGAEIWREFINLSDPEERKQKFHNLYKRQLQSSAGVKYVRSFEMKNAGNRTEYYLFYATNSLLGLKKMKEAMWKVDPSGDYTFSDATNFNQLMLFSDEPRLEILKAQIINNFQGKEATIQEIEEFVITETAFRETHYKDVLKEIEQSNPAGLAVISPLPTRRRGTYSNPQMRIRFALKQGQLM